MCSAVLPQHAAESMQAAASRVDEFLPHGYCYLWNRPLLVTHIASDLLIGLAYVAISLALAALVHRARREIPFSAVFVAFGLFIITCGLTHFLEVWTLWRPDYWLSGGVKAVTAVASVATAAAMPFTVPRALSTIRDARTARAREVAAARAAALEEQNALLHEQAIELEEQREAATELAEALERTNQQLRAALAEAEGARRAAEAARAEAEGANQAKSQFLATMSHELRTPLNAIGGYTQLLEMGLHGPVTEAQQAALGRVQGAQTRLLALINDILNYAKLEGGRVEYDLQAVDVGAVLAEVAPLVEPQLRAKGLAFDVAVPEAPCVVWADREKLGQVLVNLLSNAVKFTEAHDPATGARGRVAVSVAVRDPGRPELAFVRVSDTGRGVPRAKQDAIFEPFVQVRTGYAQATEGTGLGLAISRDLARGMGGDLRVRSREGAGSTFTVALRRVGRAGGEPRPDKARAPSARAEAGLRPAADAGADADPALGIPPALDRALAGAVLAAASGAAPGATPSAEGTAAVAAAVTHVADALAAQGARGDAVLLALEDAFAALLAGQRDPVRRGQVRALAADARALVAARLAPAAGDDGRPAA